MKNRYIEEEIRSFLSNITIIDFHEHLVPERYRTNQNIDFSIFFSHYTKADLLSAGMTENEYNSVIHPDHKYQCPKNGKYLSLFTK